MDLQYLELLLTLKELLAEQMKLAIANHQTLSKIISEMHEISQKLILQAPETAQNSTKKTILKRP